MPVNPIVQEVWNARFSGYAALAALLLSQAMSPLRRLGLVSALTHLRWRRRWGILAALLASVHGLLQWLTYLRGGLRDSARETLWLQFGLVSWALLLALWLTSYPKLVRWLRVRHWRELHWLAYVATWWAGLHVLLAPWSDPRLGLVILMFTVLLQFLRWIKFPPILKR